MDFDLDDEERQAKETARRFALREIDPIVDEWDQELWLAGDDEAPPLLKKTGFSPGESSTTPVMAARSLVPEIDAEEFVARTYLTLADAGGLPR